MVTMPQQSLRELILDGLATGPLDVLVYKYRVLDFRVNSYNSVSGQSNLNVLVEGDDSEFPCRDRSMSRAPKS
jgi:hypothetical protein